VQSGVRAVDGQVGSRKGTNQRRKVELMIEEVGPVGLRRRCSTGFGRGKEHNLKGWVGSGAREWRATEQGGGSIFESR